MAKGKSNQVGEQDGEELEAVLPPGVTMSDDDIDLVVFIVLRLVCNRFGLVVPTSIANAKANYRDEFDNLRAAL